MKVKSCLLILGLVLSTNCFSLEIEKLSKENETLLKYINRDQHQDECLEMIEEIETASRLEDIANDYENLEPLKLKVQANLSPRSDYENALRAYQAKFLQFDKDMRKLRKRKKQNAHKRKEFESGHYFVDPQIVVALRPVVLNKQDS